MLCDCPVYGMETVAWTSKLIHYSPRVSTHKNPSFCAEAAWSVSVTSYHIQLALMWFVYLLGCGSSC